MAGGCLLMQFSGRTLIPTVQKSGLLTAYLNLWDAREPP
jgi:hypothetical protein